MAAFSPSSPFSSSFSSSSSSSSLYNPPPSYERSLEGSGICPRTGTITKLAKALDKARVSLVRGPPSSGKTILARLLQIYYLSRQEPVIFLTGWPPQTVDPPIYLAGKCEEAGHTVDFISLQYSNITFIIDEAQQSYADRALWLGLIKSQSGCHSGARICLFASYGDPVMGMPEGPGCRPVHLQSKQRVSLLRHHEPHGPHSSDVGLFYMVSEFEHVLQLWTAVEIEPEAKNYLYYMTSGHPGAVEAFMPYIMACYELKNDSAQPITQKDLSQFLENEAAFFESLQASRVFRSFQPTPPPPAATALRRILQEGKIPCDLDDPGVRLCFESGWVHTDYTHSSPVGVENLVCFLPTRLHEMFLVRLLGVGQPGSFF